MEWANDGWAKLQIVVEQKISYGRRVFSSLTMPFPIIVCMIARLCIIKCKILIGFYVAFHCHPFRCLLSSIRTRSHAYAIKAVQMCGCCNSRTHFFYDASFGPKRDKSIFFLLRERTRCIWSVTEQAGVRACLLSGLTLLPHINSHVCKPMRVYHGYVRHLTIV